MAAKPTVIDATGCVIGRFASHVAKRLLNGEKIDVINCEKLVVFAGAEPVYKAKVSRGSRDWGPFFPKQPQLIFRRTVRGMLPRKITRGREALGRLKVHTGSAGLTGETVKSAMPRSTMHKRMSLGELAKRLGATVRW